MDGNSTTLPQEFFTLQSMLTLGGASTATWLVCNVLQHVANFNPRWLALVLAEAFAIFGTYQHAHVPSDVVVAIINGFLIYSSAVGIAQITGANNPPATGMGAPAGASPSTRRRTFRSSWW
jgi:hypothetical protein